MQTLRALGADDSLIRRIFVLEGWLISLLGAVAGIALGLILCWLQKQFGLIAMGQTEGNFIVEAYPVSVYVRDIVLILLTTLLVGALSVWYPVRYFSRNLL